jgi:glucose/arabinose dehydrogenase
MRLPWTLAATLALALAACDEPVAEGGAALEAAAQSPGPERAPVLLVPRPGSATARTPVAAPALTDVVAAPAAVDRVTGGNGPRHRLIEPDPPFRTSSAATFNEPWAMTFLPDGRLLVTEKGGTLRLFNPATGQTGTVSGVPAVAYGGQGGLGDVILHPQYASNRLVYLSHIERSGALYGAVVVRARFTPDATGGGHLDNVQRIWAQVPKVSGQGHFSHRLAFDAAGKLWITSGDRQKFDPAQDMSTNLGKILRLNDDGGIPADNPFAAQGGVAAQVWSLGHRNPLGIAFDAAGRLWSHEMGPMGGDELNLVLRGRNYGWPLVSNGNHYDGTPIPGHATRPDLEAPRAWWTPVIAPAGMIIYSGTLFPGFRGHAFIGGLSSQALVRVRFDGTGAAEHRRYPMGRRIREVEQGPDGAIWLLEDGANARLLKLTPAG